MRLRLEESFLESMESRERMRRRRIMDDLLEIIFIYRFLVWGL